MRCQQIWRKVMRLVEGDWDGMVGLFFGGVGGARRKYGTKSKWQQDFMTRYHNFRFGQLDIG